MCRHLIWLSASTPSECYRVDYRSLLLHAIARDATVFSHGSCLYAQLDDEVEGDVQPMRYVPDMDVDDDDEEAGDEEMAPSSAAPASSATAASSSTPAAPQPIPITPAAPVDITSVTELRFVPTQNGNESESVLEALFKAVSECAAMNPDELSDGEGDFVFDESSSGMPTSNDDKLRALAVGMHVDQGAFDDDDEDDGVFDVGQGADDDFDEEACALRAAGHVVQDRKRRKV